MPGRILTGTLNGTATDAANNISANFGLPPNHNIEYRQPCADAAVNAHPALQDPKKSAIKNTRCRPDKLQRMKAISLVITFEKEIKLYD